MKISAKVGVTNDRDKMGTKMAENGEIYFCKKLGLKLHVNELKLM
jgi:hypothetical protein